MPYKRLWDVVPPVLKVGTLFLKNVGLRRVSYIAL